MLKFFEQCKFPTLGITENQIDGPSLIILFKDVEAEDIFTVCLCVCNYYNVRACTQSVCYIECSHYLHTRPSQAYVLRCT